MPFTKPLVTLIYLQAKLREVHKSKQNYGDPVRESGQLIVLSLVNKRAMAVDMLKYPTY